MHRVIVCSDGTWNSPQKDCQTNVAKLFAAIKNRDSFGTQQRKFYDPGVGTAFGEKLRGGLGGYGISQNIRDAYRFLVYNYAPGDEIYLFGFSRGAYTARSVAGMLRNCGLLRIEHVALIDDAYTLYRDRGPETKPSSKLAGAFRQNFCHDNVRIKCVGVWDTVGALGIPMGDFNPLQWANQFHDLKLSDHIQNAFHAVSIDEQRSQFRPTLWDNDQPAQGQTIEQVWFAGVHANIGGGYPDCGLSDLAFEWMLAKVGQLGLEFDGQILDAMLKPNELGRLYDSRSAPYKLFPPYVRPIGRLSSESVHVSAVNRRRLRGPGYRPANLEDYLGSPQPRITP